MTGINHSPKKSRMLGWTGDPYFLLYPTSKSKDGLVSKQRRPLTKSVHFGMHPKKEGKQITTTLFTAKSRVSPLKSESVSRQELVACVLAIRITSEVQEKYPATVDYTFFWTDSEVCLVWINRTAKSFKAFVA